mmetsp:Transcript_8890/g.24316  ORF Transcript_8890/g.24316 Transcript_8890/m.24316 type:complete len:239 (+) Transcript_8890:130-846(+)
MHCLQLQPLLACTALREAHLMVRGAPWRRLRQPLSSLLSPPCCPNLAAMCLLHCSALSPPPLPPPAAEEHPAPAPPRAVLGFLALLESKGIWAPPPVAALAADKSILGNFSAKVGLRGKAFSVLAEPDGEGRPPDGDGVCPVLISLRFTLRARSCSMSSSDEPNFSCCPAFSSPTAQAATVPGFRLSASSSAGAVKSSKYRRRALGRPEVFSSCSSGGVNRTLPIAGTGTSGESTLPS